MSLKHAILGFLNLEPMSGYDLKHIFDRSVRHFWSAKQSQIYRELTNLLGEGYVEVERVRQEKKPDKKVYYITQSGRDELMKWMRTPLETEPHRMPFLIQVFFFAAISQEEVLRILEDQEDQHKTILELLKGETTEYARKTARNLPNPENEEFFMLTLELGIRQQETFLSWLEWAKQRVRR